MTKATRTKQPDESSKRSGIVAGQQQLASGGSRWPRLRLGNGDRARFHCLTSGDDENLQATRFHKFGTGNDTRYFVCLRVLTGGAEACSFCDQGHDDTGGRFALWVFVYNILHAAQTDSEWKATKVDDRTLFKEEIKRPLLIRMAAGRKQEWFSLFVNAWTTHGDLQNHIYELARVGSGRDDTDYSLAAIKEQAIVKTILESEEVKELPSVEEVLREELKFGPSAAGVGASGMGSDEVLGSDSGEELPSEEKSSEGCEAPPDDDLI